MYKNNTYISQCLFPCAVQDGGMHLLSAANVTISVIRCMLLNVHQNKQGHSSDSGCRSVQLLSSHNDCYEHACPPLTIIFVSFHFQIMKTNSILWIIHQVCEIIACVQIKPIKLSALLFLSSSPLTWLFMLAKVTAAASLPHHYVFMFWVTLYMKMKQICVEFLGIMQPNTSQAEQTSWAAVCIKYICRCCVVPLAVHVREQNVSVLCRPLQDPGFLHRADAGDQGARSVLKRSAKGHRGGWQGEYTVVFHFSSLNYVSNLTRVSDNNNSPNVS